MRLNLPFDSTVISTFGLNIAARTSEGHDDANWSCCPRRASQDAAAAPAPPNTPARVRAPPGALSQRLSRARSLFDIARTPPDTPTSRNVAASIFRSQHDGPASPGGGVGSVDGAGACAPAGLRASTAAGAGICSSAFHMPWVRSAGSLEAAAAGGAAGRILGASPLRRSSSLADALALSAPGPAAVPSGREATPPHGAATAVNGLGISAKEDSPNAVVTLSMGSGSRPSSDEPSEDGGGGTHNGNGGTPDGATGIPDAIVLPFSDIPAPRAEGRLFVNSSAGSFAGQCNSSGGTGLTPQSTAPSISPFKLHTSASMDSLVDCGGASPVPATGSYSLPGAPSVGDAWGHEPQRTSLYGVAAERLRVKLLLQGGEGGGGYNASIDASIFAGSASGDAVRPVPIIVEVRDLEAHYSFSATEPSLLRVALIPNERNLAAFQSSDQYRPPLPHRACAKCTAAVRWPSQSCPWRLIQGSALGYWGQTAPARARPYQ